MKRNLRLFGAIAAAMAFLCLIAETTLYGDVDANGILQESLFLPLIFIFAFLGVVLVGSSFLIKSRK